MKYQPLARIFGVLSVLLLAGSPASAQPPLFTDALPKAEFAARRARVMEQIGDAVVVVQGTTETSSYEKFRQSNQFFYLSGIEVPRAILVVDGRAKSSTLYIAPKDERMERSEGPLLVPGPEAETLTGIDRVLPHDRFATDAKALDGRVVYTTFRGETVGAGTPDREASHRRARAADPWDQMPSREDWFMKKLGAQAKVEFKNLDPILDAMRMIKSPREIALIRESTRIAGQGLMEAMRSAEPGMYEYELEAIADYIFKKNNAQGIAYFALVAAGKNASWPHYHASQALIRDGEMVLFDYAPDYKYYASDVTRMFPINGRFTADQRELYRYVREAVQRHHDLRAPRKCQRAHAGDRREDGRRPRVHHLRESEEQGGGDPFRRGIPHPRPGRERNQPRPHGRHGSARRDRAVRRAEAGHDLHDRAGDDDSGRSHLYPS